MFPFVPCNSLGFDFHDLPIMYLLIDACCPVYFTTVWFKTGHVHIIAVGKPGRPVEPAVSDQLWTTVIHNRTNNVNVSINRDSDPQVIIRGIKPVISERRV